MNLCSFCIHYADISSQCRMIPEFNRPSHTRVYCCKKFTQYPISYADMRFSDYSGNDIGCIGSKPSIPIPKKNQVVFMLGEQ